MLSHRCSLPLRRCERASAYVKSLGSSFQDVVQLKGRPLPACSAHAAQAAPLP